MKRSLLISFTCLSTTLFAQRFSVEVGWGYQRNLAATIVESTRYESSQNTDSETERADKFGISNGIIERVQLNYQVNPALFFFLGARYVSGKQTFIYDYSHSTTTNYNQENIRSLSTHYQSLDVQLGMGIRKQVSDRIGIHSAVALSIAPFTQFDWTFDDAYQESDPTSSNSFKTSKTYRYANYVNLGWYSDLGITYALNDHFDLCAAVAFRGMATSPSKSTQTAYTMNGVDQLAGIPADQLVDTYVNDPSPTVANDYKRYWISRTSAEMTLGIRYKLGGTPVFEKTATELPRFYAELASGYGIPLGANYGSFQTNLNTNKRASLGQGGYVMAFIGMPIKQLVSLEAGVLYNSTSMEYEEHDALASKHSFTADMLRVALGVKFAHQLGKFQVAIKTGALTGGSEKMVVRDEEVNYLKEERFTGGFTLGAYSSIQLDWHFSKSFGIFCQTMAILQGWAPKRSELTHHSFYGTDYLATDNVSQSQTEYVSEYTEDNTTVYDPNKPSKAIKTIEPFGSLVFSIGIRYSLW